MADSTVLGSIRWCAGFVHRPLAVGTRPKVLSRCLIILEDLHSVSYTDLHARVRVVNRVGVTRVPGSAKQAQNTQNMKMGCFFGLIVPMFESKL